MKIHRDWRAIRRLLPFLWLFKDRVTITLVLRLLAKVVNDGMPLALKGATAVLSSAANTDGISRSSERGKRGLSFLLNFMIFNILPTLVEI